MNAPDPHPGHLPAPALPQRKHPPAWKEALLASWHTILPILFLQSLMALLVIGHFFNWPIDIPLQWLADIHQNGGLFLSFVATGFAGGVLSEIAYVFFLQWRQWHRENIEEMIFKFFLLGSVGTLTDILYRIQFHFFGDQPAWYLIAVEVIIDQLIFSAIVTTPILAVLCDWYKDHFSRARIDWWFRPGYYTAVILPVLITSWFYWVPTAALIYSLPAILHTPLYLLAMACWGVLLTVLEQEMGIDPDIPKHLTGLEISRGRFNFGRYRRSPFGRLAVSKFENIRRIPPHWWFYKDQPDRKIPIVLKPDEAISFFKIFEEARKNRDLQLMLSQWRLLNQTIHVQGDLRLPGNISHLPANLVFLDSLDASESNITHFDSTVKGNANFAGSNIKTIGPNARFEKDLDASNTPNLKKFMGFVQGDANFADSHVHTIGRSASVGGKLNTANAPNFPTSHNLGRPTERQLMTDVHTQAENRQQQQQQQHGPKAL